MFRIRSDPLLLGFPDPAYSSEYHVNKLKIISITYEYVVFSPSVMGSIYLPLRELFIDPQILQIRNTMEDKQKST